MQNKEKVFIGIDVSKKTVDICVLSNHSTECLTLKNDSKVFRKQLVKIQKNGAHKEFFIGFENTGFYNFPLYEALEDLNVNVYIFNPLHLVKSMGMVRGKTDKIDATRIAHYLKVNIGQLTPSIVPSENFRQLKVLFAKRLLYVEQLKALKTSNKEAIHCLGKNKISYAIKNDEKLIQLYKTLIKEIEHQMLQIISKDEALEKNVQRAMSVPGVGFVLATYLTIKTNGFTQLTNPRKMACFAGVVPFKTQSGTSLNKKPRVSYMADKQMKRLLHMAALRVIQIDGELKDYFIRKVEEGKNKMSVINAVRNKIVARVCSCVNNQKMYEKSLQVS
jgi:transposase